jgi:vacuolar-type H+-ATPase subunit I/STV1
MFGEYAALAKWALIIAIFSAVVYAIEDYGYNRAWDKHLSFEKARTEKVNEVIKQEHDKALQETAKSTAFAEFIESEYNEKVNQISELKDDIIDLNSNVSRMRQRSACGHSENRVPVGNNTGIHVETANYEQFSEEFKRFLESEAKRDQLNLIWIEEAVKATNQLCKQSNVECLHD